MHRSGRVILDRPRRDSVKFGRSLRTSLFKDCWQELLLTPEMEASYVAIEEHIDAIVKALDDLEGLFAEESNAEILSKMGAEAITARCLVLLEQDLQRARKAVEETCDSILAAAQKQGLALSCKAEAERSEYESETDQDGSGGEAEDGGWPMESLSDEEIEESCDYPRCTRLQDQEEKESCSW